MLELCFLEKFKKLFKNFRSQEIHIYHSTGHLTRLRWIYVHMYHETSRNIQTNIYQEKSEFGNFRLIGFYEGLNSMKKIKLWVNEFIVIRTHSINFIILKDGEKTVYIFNSLEKNQDTDPTLSGLELILRSLYFAVHSK